MNKDNHDFVLDKEPIACARGIISYFAMFFPQELRNEVLESTIKEYEDISYDEFLVVFESDERPCRKIEMLSESIRYSKGYVKSFENLILLDVFEILFSEQINVKQRAELLSTFRVLIKSYRDFFGDYSAKFETYIRESYVLFRESTTMSWKVNFCSEVFLGSKIKPFNLADINLPTTEEECDSKTSDIIPTEENLFYCKKIPYDWEKTGSGLDTKPKRETFLGFIYDSLKGISKYNNEEFEGKLKKRKLNIKELKNVDKMGLLTFPEQESKLHYTKDSDSGKIYPCECTKANFIAMFEDVNDEKPVRTQICGTSDCIAKFIEMLAPPHATRSNVAEAFRCLIVNTSGAPFSSKTPFPKNERHRVMQYIYMDIFTKAKEKVKEDFKVI